MCCWWSASPSQGAASPEHRPRRAGGAWCGVEWVGVGGWMRWMNEPAWDAGPLSLNAACIPPTHPPTPIPIHGRRASVGSTSSSTCSSRRRRRSFLEKRKGARRQAKEGRKKRKEEVEVHPPPHPPTHPPARHARHAHTTQPIVRTKPAHQATMFRNTFQSGFLSILYSLG